ncbi:LPD38 domain-containing protein [Comamonas sediminis]|uniref:LPD38 domain-containing protein n=1 Tax=Comamonas sediminis TaxID=1783360 RepID=UPI003D2847B7
MTPELAAAIMRIKMPATVDTVRAAVRDLVGGLGTLPNRLGRVVVATSAEIRQTWEPLIGPVAMEAAGDTGRAQGFYDPKTKTVFLIADHIQRGQEAGVVAHELMHKHGEAVLGAEGWQQLHGMIEGWASAPEGSMEQRVYSEAQARVQSSMPEGAQQQQYSSQELFPYAVQVALEMGVRPNLLAKPGTVARWLGQVRSALRQVWANITGKPDQFEAQDMVNLAFGIAQRENPEHVGELDGLSTGEKNPLQRGVGRPDGQQAESGAALAPPREVNPGDPAKEGGSISQATEPRNSERPSTSAGGSGVQFSRAATAGITDNYNPSQKQAAEKAFGAVAKQTVAERAKEMRSNLGTKLRQGLVDQFAPIKEVSMHAYMLARLSKASDGAVEAALLYGKPFLRDGVTDVDIKDGGFAKVLASLKGEHDRFFQWVAALRAERLKAEGKENLLTDQDISALKSLNAGTFEDGTPRMPAYAAALRELNAFNEAGLKIAKESGLIDQAAMDLMKDQPYVPFYRLMEDGDIKGARFSSGLINQQAFKKLKGGTQQINADLLQNTLLNWSHLYAAAARNRAALATMKDAESMGIAYQVPADTKGAVKVMRDGVTEHWMIEDPYLLDAVSALHYTPSKLAQGMAPFKRLLTMGVTINPTFKIRNLIRDSLSAMAQSDLGYNPFANVAQGWKAMDKNSQTQASMLASGGIIKFGTQEDTGALRRKIEKLGGTMLDKDGFGKLKSQMASLWEAYEEFGDRTENANRAALYERLIAKGHSHAEASFMARDLMDFSMSGKWEMVRFLTQTVPFLNARMQGLYKLGRAAAEDPKRFGAIAGAVSLASLGLLAAYQDDEDWKKRDDWDRDSYWWFKIGNQAFRIPKPFEVGSIGTLAERTAELMLSKEMTGKRFGERLSDMIFNTFAMDPTPQAVKPLLDVYANKDSFSGKAIEGFADERLRPQDRFSDRTSEVARLLGSWGLPDPVKLAKGDYSALSPKQIDFLMRGYTGWLSTVFTTATDTVLRPMMGRGDRPEMKMRDVFLAGNFVENLPTNSSRYVSTMYDQAREISQVWASYQAAVKSGDVEGAAKIRAANPEALAKRIPVEAAKTRVAELSQQAKKVEGDRLMSAEAKRRRLDEIAAQKDAIAKRLATL